MGDWEKYIFSKSVILEFFSIITKFPKTTILDTNRKNVQVSCVWIHCAFLQIIKLSIKHLCMAYSVRSGALGLGMNNMKSYLCILVVFWILFFSFSNLLKKNSHKEMQLCIKLVFLFAYNLWYWDIAKLWYLVHIHSFLF